MLKRINKKLPKTISIIREKHTNTHQTNFARTDPKSVKHVKNLSAHIYIYIMHRLTKMLQANSNMNQNGSTNV